MGPWSSMLPQQPPSNALVLWLFWLLPSRGRPPPRLLPALPDPTAHHPWCSVSTNQGLHLPWESRSSKPPKLLCDVGYISSFSEPHAPPLIKGCDCLYVAVYEAPGTMPGTEPSGRWADE